MRPFASQVFTFFAATAKVTGVALFLLFIPEKSLFAEETKDAPAPTTDRVGFPKDYAQTFTVLRTKVDLPGRKRVTIYGNAQAASIAMPAGLPYPNGSVIVMETASLKNGADGKPLVATDGSYRSDLVVGLHVMRREAGFGKEYGAGRSGDWEFVEYRTDGTYITPPQKSASCSACHLKAGREKDYVFKARFADPAK